MEENIVDTQLKPGREELKEAEERKDGVLNLLPAHITALLTILNEPKVIERWKELFRGEAYKHHQSMEAETYDTDCSEFHREGLLLANDSLREMKASLDESTPSYILNLLSCVDVFAITASGVKSSWNQAMIKWVVAQTGKRPFVAFRVGYTLFYLPGHGKARWEARPWLESEDMQCLPYQRKYDHERHGRADEQLRRDYERLEVANDLLGVFSERLNEVGPAD